MKVIQSSNLITSLPICIIAFYLVLCVPLCSSATHIAGADLTYDCIDGSSNEYEIELVLYRDCEGIEADQTQNINISSQNLNQDFDIFVSQIQNTGQEITNPCSSAPSTCQGGSATGIERYIYRETVQLPQAATDWVLNFRRRARNNAITTVDLTTNSNGAFYSPGTTGPYTYLEATLDNVNAPCNTSPDFSNVPITFFCVNQNSTYNQAVNDPDGDSIAYELITPKDDEDATVVYNPPFTATNPLNGSPSLTIDPITGDLNLTPTSQEVSVLAIRSKEYRNGQLIGSVIRDIQVYANNCQNDLPELSGINGTSNFTTSTCAGDNICFNINASDNNANQNVTITWDETIPGATFNVSGTSNSPTATFCWTPSQSDINSQNTFTATVQDDACPKNGAQTFSYTIDVEGFTSVDLGPDINKCAATDTLTASVNGSGGPYNFNWSNGNSGQSIVVSSSGTYSVTATTPNGCEGSDTVQVQLSQIKNQDVISWQDSSICGGSSLTIDAGSGFDSYEWSNGDLTQTTTVTNSGTYFVTVTDQLGCQSLDTVSVSLFPTPNVNLGADTIICQGESITLDAGAAFDSYQWSTGAGSPTINVSSPGTYRVTVTDTNGCTASSTVEVNQPQALKVSIANTTDVSCKNGSDGSADVAVSGGTPPYDYSWSNSATTQNISNVTAGTYNVTVTDDNGCSATTIATVTQPSELQVSVDNTTQPLCSNGNDGLVNISVSGGTPFYTYNWSNGSSNEDLVNVSAGTYSVTVTDNNGCTATTSTTLSQSTALSISIDSIQTISCNGQSDGIIDISPSGGTPGYNYNWSNGSTSEDLLNVSAGSYSVTVTDKNGCQAVADTMLSEPDQLTPTISNTGDVSCNGGNDGSISINVNGGAAGYDYSWSNGATTQNISGLTAGSYNVTVIDNNGCTATTGTTVNEIPSLNVDVVTTNNVSCNGSSDGGIDIAVNGGTPNYSYQWSNGNGSEDLNGVTAGTYSVTITDDNNCTVSNSATVNEPQELSISLVAKNNLSCSGGNDGAINISVNGGTPSYNFSWSNGTSTQDLTGITSGTYQVTVSDQNNCSTTASYTLSEPNPLTANTSNSNVSCAGAADGSIAITNTSGGTAPYVYSTDGLTFQSTDTFKNLSGGIYNVIVRDVNNCTFSITDTIQEPSPLQVSIDSVANLKCSGSTNGNIDITATGGTKNYTYEWSNDSTTSDLRGVGAGSYTVTVTDQNGCTATNSATLTEPSPITVNIVDTTNISCNGGENGSIEISVSDGKAPYNYDWNNNDSTGTINGLSAGTYTVTVTDNNDCDKTRSITLNQPSNALSATTSSTNLTCFGENNGTIEVTGTSGGTPPYSYSMDGINFQNGTDFTGLSAGAYSIVVKDAKGCTLLKQDTIGQPETIQINIDDAEVPACSGSDTGKIFISVSGGTPGYSYQWSNGSSDQDQTGLSDGTYIVTVTDINGCTSVDSVTLSEPDQINVSLASKSNVTCNGGNDGSLDINIIGGTPPYNYNWSNGDTTEDLNSLSAGSYKLTLTDDNGCDTTLTDSTLTFTITEPNQLTFTTTSSKLSERCAGADDGSISVQSATGGTTPYQYSIDGVNYQTSPTFTNLNAGVYNVFLRDSNNCTFQVTDTIGEPAKLQASINSVTDINCFTNNSGSVDLNVTGGQGGYSYYWSNDSSTQDLSGVDAGVYSVTVTDTNNCTATATAKVSQPLQLTIGLANKQDISCNGGNDGLLAVSGNGGEQPYHYNWSNGDTTPIINKATAATYTVTVTDNNGCTATKSFTLDEPQELTFSTTSKDDTCGTAGTGSITVTNPGGGVPPYTYSLNGISYQNSNSFTDLSGGVYNVIVKDDSNCTSVLIDTIDEPATLTVTIDSTIEPSCQGNATGEIGISVAGGTPNFSYEWSNGDITQDLSGITAGNYSLTVTDKNNCSVNVSTTLDQPTPLTIDLDDLSDVTCNGGANGTIDVSINGGTPSYTYQWSNNSTNQDLNGVSEGTYTLTVTDQSNCTALKSFTIDQSDALSLTTNSTDVSCAGAMDGIIEVTDTAGGTPSYEFSIDGVNYQSSSSFSNLSNGVYNVFVRDSNLCTSFVTDTITEPQQLSVELSSINDPACFGETGDIAISVSGGSPSYNYQWSNGDTSKDLSAVSEGSYTVTVTDKNGCNVIKSAILTAPDELDINVTNTGNISCNGGSDGFINVNVIGGEIPYSYIWSHGSVNQDPSNLQAGSYTLTVTDANGCADTQDVTLTEPNPLNVSTTTTAVSCAGQGDGSLTISANGGISPYEYSLDGFTFQSKNTFTSLSGGIYNVMIEDANNCSIVIQDTVDEANQLQVVIDSVVEPSCNGDQTGAVFTSVSGGIAGYSYNWSEGSTSKNITNLGADNYSVTVTDAEGCTATNSATINETDKLQINIADSSSISCQGGNDGFIDISVNGGNQPYTYAWSNGSTTEDQSGLSAGTYGLTVTDAENCSATYSISLSEPAALTLSTTSTDIICNGDKNGAIFVDSTAGGVPPYEYSLDGITYQNAKDFTNLSPGIYDVIVRDTNNCTSVVTDTIDEPAQLNIVIDTINNIACNGDSTGDIDISVNGGVPGYTYNWSNSESSDDQDVTAVGSGTYTVTVIDTNGCTDTASATITQSGNLSVGIASKDNISCSGGSDGRIDITVNGGAQPYSYDWNNGSTNQDLNNVSSGTYTVTITDVQGCDTTISVTLTEPDALSITTSTTDVTCRDTQDGAIDVSSSGGNGGNSYQWSTGDTSKDLQGIEPGTYTLSIVDTKGCSIEETFEVGLLDSISISLPDSTYATCDTSKDGSLSVEATKGTKPYNYNWSNNSTGSTIESLTAGNYTVTATSSIGCTATKSFTIGAKFDTCITQYPPVAVDDNDTTLKGDKVTVNVLNNDYDPNGDSITFISINQYPDNGYVTVTPEDSVAYNPNSGFIGVDSFTYIICDTKGLCDTATVYINVEGRPDIFIPDGYSPNGDGSNDEFVIDNLNAYDENEIKIFNRWGNEVYRAENYENDWSGTHNGNPLPDATYYYILKVWDDEGQNATFNGHVIIHRFKN